MPKRSERSTPISARSSLPRILLFCLMASTVSAAPQPWRSSVVGTEFDFIRSDDPSTFLCLEFKGEMLREMPDKRTRGGKLKHPAFVFVAYFSDGTRIDIAVDADFGSREAARKEAERYPSRLGRLPTSLRRGVERLVVHRGGTRTTAFSDVGLIVVYSGNASRRIGTHDLEETLFHESVHAAWDRRHRSSDAWKAAQRSDGAFITHYAREKPNREDLAESALFAYTLVHHPERIPEPHATRIRETIPARIAFVRGLLPPDKPLFESVGPVYACDGSGSTFVVTPDRGSPQDILPDGLPRPPGCHVNPHTAVGLSDILSNALHSGLDIDETRVRPFLDHAKQSFDSAEQLLAAAVIEFGIERARLDAAVAEFLHCNCGHASEAAVDAAPALDAPMPPPAATPSAARPVTPAPAPDLRPLLYGIGALLLLLLVVNTAILRLLVKQSRARS